MKIKKSILYEKKGNNKIIIPQNYTIESLDTVQDCLMEILKESFQKE